MKKMVDRLKSCDKALLVQIFMLSLFMISIMVALCGLLIQKDGTDDIYNKGIRGVQVSAKILCTGRQYIPVLSIATTGHA